MPTTLEQLAAALLGADTQKEIAAQNPYYDFASAVPKVGDTLMKLYAFDKLGGNNTEYTKSDATNAALVAGLTGLLGGTLESFGDDYQAELSDRYTKAVAGLTAGESLSAEASQLPEALFGSAKRKAALFQLSSKLEDQAMAREVKAAGLKKGAEIAAENAIWEDAAKKANGSAAAAIVPVVTPEAGTGAVVVGKSPFAIPEGPAPSPVVAKILGNPNNPIIKEQVRLSEKAQADVTDLRKELNAIQVVKDFPTVERSARILKEAVADPSAVTDQELVRYSILLIEPGMAVREGEQKAVALSQSIPEAWKGGLAKALNGSSALGPEIRTGLLRLAGRAYTGSLDQYNRVMDNYTNIATARGLDASLLNRYTNLPSAAELFSGAKIAGQTDVAGLSLIQSAVTKAKSGQKESITPAEWDALRQYKQSQ